MTHPQLSELNSPVYIYYGTGGWISHTRFIQLRRTDSTRQRKHRVGKFRLAQISYRSSMQICESRIKEHGNGADSAGNIRKQAWVTAWFI